MTANEESSKKKQKTKDEHELIAEGTFLISLDSSYSANTSEIPHTDSTDSIVSVPSTSTHSQYDTRQQKKYSALENYVRISDY